MTGQKTPKCLGMEWPSDDKTEKESRQMVSNVRFCSKSIGIK